VESARVLASVISFDHCVIAVGDWERSNAFYAAVLGAEVVRVGSGYAYRFGDAQLNVHGPGVDGEPNANPPVVPGGADLCFVWRSGIDEAIAHLASHQVEVELGPVTRFGARGNGTSVYFRDPDGSLLELISYT
jgi:catechol 2,3-dioxygenase-like lactoylglutathione lyase family enzyme